MFLFHLQISHQSKFLKNFELNLPAFVLLLFFFFFLYYKTHYITTYSCDVNLHILPRLVLALVGPKPHYRDEDVGLSSLLLPGHEAGCATCLHQ